MKPKVETIIAMRMSVAPVCPANCTAAAASGALAVSGAARALPRMPWATSWTAMYSTPTPVTARPIARGTADVDDGEAGKYRDEEQGARQRAAEARRQPTDGVGEHGGDGAHRERDAEPEQHAAQEPRVGTERRLDVGVRAAAPWDAAAGLCDAEGNECRRHGADEVGKGSCGTEAACHVRGEHEDRRADGDIENGGREPAHADDAAQRGLVGGRGR